MSEVLELNREEITRLSQIDDAEGHVWAFYLLLKKHMDLYTGLVQVEKKTLVSVAAMQLHIIEGQEEYIEGLVATLIQSGVLSDYIYCKDILSMQLPIAFSDVCLEPNCQH